MRFNCTKIYLSIALLLCFSLSSQAAYNILLPVDSLKAEADLWHLKDPITEGVQGVSLEKAYQFLEGKTSTTVIVAVIDSGIDIEHEDLKENVWSNPGEIASNGQDDDGNGYIDDVHGWNFLGNASGENIVKETYEYIRLYAKYDQKFKGKTSVPAQEAKEFKLYKQVKKKYLESHEKQLKEKENFETFSKNLSEATAIIQKYLEEDNFDLEDLKKVEREDEQLIAAKSLFITLFERGFTWEGYKEYGERIDDRLIYQLNINYQGREEIIGDDPENVNDIDYGNPDVIGSEEDEHGTHVAGIIAAVRSNNLGVDGLVTNVKIMPIRAVPDGDERDKDVANAIRYAVDNGAKIINMSFGKGLSPQKAAVDDAVRYAEEKGVLLIHAAGNAALNLDKESHYPNQIYENGHWASNWLTVGASDQNVGLELMARFSNYGRKNVDLFAPGVDIYATLPGNNYDKRSGTSMAAPVVSGVAALVLSYYPSLTATQLRGILMASTLKFNKLKANRPELEKEKRKKVKFTKMSVSGGIVNAFEAVKLANKITSLKN